MLDNFDIIKEHILSCYPNEACGVILQDNSVIPIENVSDKPLKSFKPNKEILAKYIGQIKYLYHSHCRDIKEPEIFDLRTPSFSDIVSQRQTRIPWLIFGTEGYSVNPEPLEIPRKQNSNYLERPFIWYIYDCYSLIQDYYKYEFDIILPDHKAETDYKEIRKLDRLFEKYIQEYGFIEYSPFDHIYQHGDIIVTDSNGFEQNHLGLYLPDGNILHQDMLSRTDPLPCFINRIHKVLRHESKNS